MKIRYTIGYQHGRTEGECVIVVDEKSGINDDMVKRCAGVDVSDERHFSFYIKRVDFLE